MDTNPKIQIKKSMDLNIISYCPPKLLSESF